MEAILGKWKEEAYVLMRIMMGFMICCHGAQKLFGVFDGEGHAEGLWLAAGMIETTGGLLMMIGLFASLVAFLLSGDMAVAYFLVHAHLRFWPILNGGGIFVTNCFVLPVELSQRARPRLPLVLCRPRFPHRSAILSPPF